MEKVSIQFTLTDLFVELYSFFYTGKPLPQEEQEAESDLHHFLQMIMSDIENLEMDKHEKLSDIEDLLLLMHLIVEVHLNGLPPNDENLGLLVRKIIKTHELTTNPQSKTSEILTVSDLAVKCDLIKPNSYQHFIVKYLTQVRNNILKEVYPFLHIETTKFATQLQYALYYYYLQESGDYPKFKHKTKETNEIGIRHNINPTNFRLKYNKINAPITGKQFRQQIDPEDSTKVLQMLSDYPKARDIARLDLDKLKNS